MNYFHHIPVGIVALLLLIGPFVGCTDTSTITEAPPPQEKTLFEVLGIDSADLKGVDVSALKASLDAHAIADGVYASEHASSEAATRGKKTFVNPGESIQAAVDTAPSGSMVFVRPGNYEESVSIMKPIHLVGLGGPGSVVIQDPGDQQNGIFARDVAGLSIINVTVRGFSRNGIFFVGVDGFLLFRVATDQLREGEYGLFPVQSRNGLIAHSTATGAADAGFYVGQSENVAVVHNQAYGNVIGFEAENVRRNVWAHNRGYENSAGMLAILLPPSQHITVLHADQLVVSDNRFTDNNVDNFAEEGELASFVPSGTGLLVIGYDDSVVLRNRVTGNGFVGIGLGSTATLWSVAGRDPADLAAIDPHPDNVQIIRNRATGNGFEGSDLPLPPADLFWDRPLYDSYGTGNCWSNNVSETTFPAELPACE